MNAAKLVSIQRYQALIEGYGFVYRPVEQILRIAFWLFLIVCFSLYFEMHIALFGLVVLVALGLIPLSFLWQYEYLHEEAMFKELTMMIQQIIASFKIHPKLIGAMSEVRELCSGSLRTKMDDVIKAMESGRDFASSMRILEQEYSFFVLANLSCLMVMVEQYGARKYHEALDLIQDDLDNVIEDMYLHQQELMQTKNKVFVLCLLALIVGVMSKHMLQGLFVFSSHAGYQLSLFLFVLSLMASLVLAQRSLRHSWVVWEKQHD